MNKSSIALQVLISENADTLWSPYYRREVSRLLRYAGNSFDKKQLNSLTDAIIKGPPRNLYGEMPDDEWVKLRDNDILYRLNKLKKSQIALPTKAEKFIQRTLRLEDKDIIKDEETNHRDEFSFYTSSGWSSSYDDDYKKTSKPIKEMSTEEFDKYFVEEDGRGHKWSDHCKTDSNHALTKMLDFAKRNKKWPHHRWSSALYVFRQKMILISKETREYDFDKKFAEKILKTISKIPRETLKQPDVSIEFSRFINFRTFLGETPDQLYWGIWEKLWNVSINLVKDSDNDLLTISLNTACGELAEQLIYHTSNLKLQKDVELPDDLKKRANIVINGTSLGALMGKIMLISRLSFFLSVSPQWTKEKLIPLLSKEKNPKEWMQIWVGFMWSPRVHPNLYILIKKPFFDLIEDIELYSEKFNEGEQVAQLLGYLCIPEKTRVSRKDAKTLLNMLNSKLLSVVASTLENQLSGVGEDKAAKMWEEQIKPWFIYVWPKKNFATEGNVSDSLASMALNTGEAFPDCIKTLSKYLNYIDPKDNRMLLFRLSDKSDKSNKESTIPETYPKATLDLLNKLFDRFPTWHGTDFKNVLNIIVEADPKLTKTQEYKNLREIAGM